MGSKPRKHKARYTVSGYKGFDENLQCRGMQYAVGKCYHARGDIERCENGLHFCTNLLNTFAYYPPYYGRYALVSGGGAIDAGDGSDDFDTKVAAEYLHVEQEISPGELVVWLDEHEYDGDDIVLDSDLPQEESSGMCKRLTERNKKYRVEAEVCVGMDKYQYVDVMHGSAIALGGYSVAEASSSHAIAVTYRACSIAWARWYSRVAVTLGEYSIAQADGAASVVVAAEEGSRAILNAAHSIGVTFDTKSQMDSSGAYNILVCEGSVECTGINTIIVFPISVPGHVKIKAPLDTFLVFFLNPLYTSEIATMRIGDYGTVGDKTYTLEDLRSLVRGSTRQSTANMERFPLV